MYRSAARLSRQESAAVRPERTACGGRCCFAGNSGLIIYALKRQKSQALVRMATVKPAGKSDKYLSPVDGGGDDGTFRFLPRIKRYAVFVRHEHDDDRPGKEWKNLFFSPR